MQSFGFVIDLIPHAFQTNGSLSAADFLAESSRYGRNWPAWLFTGMGAAIVLVVAWVTKKPKVRPVAVVIGGLLLTLSLILLIFWPEWRVDNRGDRV